MDIIMTSYKNIDPNTPNIHYKGGYQKFIEKNFEIVSKKMELVAYILNEVQLAYLRFGSGEDIILKARQQGFSSLILAIFTVDFLTKANSRQIIIADSTENAGELLDRVKLYIESYEEKNGVKVPMKYNSKNELYHEVLHSRYTIGTANKVNLGRSKTITNLHCSEVAFYPNIQAIMTGVVQAVVPGGRVIFETTANGYNKFKKTWDAAVAGLNNFKPLFFNASDFYTKDFLDAKRKQLDRLFDQEYPETPEIAFITSGESIFEKQALKFYMDNVVDPLPNKDPDSDFRKYRQFKNGEFILCAVDTAAGGGDFTSAQFMAKDKFDIPLVYQSKNSAVEATPLIYQALENIYRVTGVIPVVTYERNNGGIFELERLKRLNKNGHYKIATTKKAGNVENSDDTLLGWSTNAATRPKIINEGKEAINNHLPKIYDRQTVEEMYSFVEKQNGNKYKIEAENGSHDDLIMSFLIVYNLWQNEEQPLNDAETQSLIDQLPEEVI